MKPQIETVTIKEIAYAVKRDYLTVQRNMVKWGLIQALHGSAERKPKLFIKSKVVALLSNKGVTPESFE